MLLPLSRLRALGSCFFFAKQRTLRMVKYKRESRQPNPSSCFSRKTVQITPYKPLVMIKKEDIISHTDDIFIKKRWGKNLHLTIIFFSIFILMAFLNMAGEVLITRSSFSKKTGFRMLISSLIGSLLISLYYYLAQKFEF